jgi:hypothetical protein
MSMELIEGVWYVREPSHDCAGCAFSTGVTCTFVGMTNCMECVFKQAGIEELIKELTNEKSN